VSVLTKYKPKMPLVARILILSGALLFIIDVLWRAGYWTVATRPLKESATNLGGVDAFVWSFVYVMIPVFTLLMIAIAFGVQIVMNKSTHWGRCRNCGYDRRGDSGTKCPECGYSDEPEESQT
jgi:hypothetical protein